MTHNSQEWNVIHQECFGETSWVLVWVTIWAYKFWKQSFNQDYASGARIEKGQGIMIKAPAYATSMWGPLLDHYYPWQGLCLVPMLGVAMDDGRGKASLCPWVPNRNIKLRTQHNEKSRMEMCGRDSPQGKSTVDCCNQGRLSKGGEKWAGPHRKDTTCCAGGWAQVCGGSQWRAMEAPPLIINTRLHRGTNFVLRALLSLSSLSYVHREPDRYQSHQHFSHTKKSNGSLWGFGLFFLL